MTEAIDAAFLLRDGIMLETGLIQQVKYVLGSVRYGAKAIEFEEEKADLTMEGGVLKNNNRRIKRGRRRCL